jgi:hypothetical protein
MNPVRVFAGQKLLITFVDPKKYRSPAAFRVKDTGLAAWAEMVDVCNSNPDNTIAAIAHREATRRTPPITFPFVDPRKSMKGCMFAQPEP